MQRQPGIHIINVIFVDCLEGVQRAAARFCKTDNHYTPSVSIMLYSLGLEPLETRRKLSGQCMMYKTIHGLVGLNIHNDLQFSEETRTRNSHAYTFQTPFSSKNALINSEAVTKSVPRGFLKVTLLEKGVKFSFVLIAIIRYFKLSSKQIMSILRKFLSSSSHLTVKLD